ncbi:MAG: PEP-CTERM sorting domain-containing protein, partial [Phycisphaerales bacterium]
GGGLMPTAVNFYPQGGISAGGGGGGGKPSGPAIHVNETTPEVPEPATGVLLVMGSLFAFARRRARKRPPQCGMNAPPK